MPVHLKVMGHKGLVRGESSYRSGTGWFDVLGTVQTSRVNVAPGRGSFSGTSSRSEDMQDASFALAFATGSRQLLDLYVDGKRMKWALLQWTDGSAPLFWCLYRDAWFGTSQIYPDRDDKGLEIRLSLLADEIRIGMGTVITAGGLLLVP